MAGEAGSGTAAPTLPPEVQEKLARLEKLEKDHASLGYKLRAWEKIDKELGDVLVRDAYGNPVNLKVDEMPPPVRSVNGHPLSPLSAYGLEKPEAVDEYYLQLLNQKGYLTKAEAEKLADARASAYANQVLGSALVWRTHDKLVSQEPYKGLADRNSDLAKRTAKILQERGYGAPGSEQSKGFDDWRYRELGDLQFAADLAQIELSKESASATASAAAAAGAQAAGGLSPAPTGGGGGAAAPGKPDFTTMSTPEQIVEALGNTLEPAGAGQP